MESKRARSGSAFDDEWRRLVAPHDYANPTPKRRYHLVVIGAGPAGLVTAIAGASLGADVALVEKSAMGGDCLNVGCVPSKALLEITSQTSRIADFDSAFAWLREVRAGLSHHDSVERYSAAGVDVFFGRARFIDDRRVDVGGTELAARRFVIATGARAAVPPIPGLQDCEPLTNETVFDLRERPAKLAILGAGPIGCELSQVFARLGTEVHLLERETRVLPTELAEASEAVQRALERGGVRLHLGASVKNFERQGSHVAIDTDAGAIRADRILVAAGRVANTDELNVAAAGVETDAAGLLIVDKRLRTSNRRIFAAGDVCSQMQFTHNADAHARIVVQNALFAPTASTRKLVVPHCTYTNPELAQVGPHRGALEARGQRFDCYRLAFAELDRGRAEGDSNGFVEVLTEPGTDRIIGATIVGHDAGEQLAGICIAMNRGIGLGSLASVVLLYPTRSEYLRRLADNYNRKKLTPAVRAAMANWFRWTR